MRGQPASLGHVSSVGRCWRFPFPLCTSTRETVQECISGLPDLISAEGESQKNYQVDLLKEILNLQADMVVMLLSMLEGEDY